jgi:hypothetical protein
MSIVVRYGNYTHAAGEVEYQIQKQAILNDLGEPVGEKVTVGMDGLLMGTSTSDMDSKVQSLRAAYLKDNQNWRVIAGSTVLDVSVDAEDTLNGIHVTQPPSFPSNKNAAYVTTLPYRIQLQWEQAVTDQLYALKSFTESLSFSGGGPRYGHIETAVELPEKQLLRRNTIYRVVQQGQAVGMYRQPLLPLPLFPGALVSAPDTTLGSGRALGPLDRLRTSEIPITWKYTFESATPLAGRPNVWGVTQ